MTEAAFQQSARQMWESSRMWYDADPVFERRAVLRSLYLRSLEAATGGRPRWRRVIGTARRLARIMLARRPGALGPGGLWLIVESATPSHLGTAMAFAELANSEGCDIVLIAGDERTKTRASHVGTIKVVGIDDLASALPLRLRWRAAVHAGAFIRRAIRSFPHGLGMARRSQLMLEAGLAAVVRTALQDVVSHVKPRAMVAPSEYFAIGTACSQVAKDTKVPWVTVQHGVMNRTYAPSVADEYWVWTQEAKQIMTMLQDDDPPTIRVVGPLRHEAIASSGDREPKSSIRTDPLGKTIVLFSQTHGLEYGREVHETLAHQLRLVLDRVEGSRVVVKLHPSEHYCLYRELFEREDRVEFVPGEAMNVPQAAALASCCVGLDSTALLEAMAVGAVAVAIGPSSGGIVLQSVAAHIVELDEVADFIESLLTSSRRMKDALAHQRERMLDLVPDAKQVEQLCRKEIRRLCCSCEG